MIANVVLVHVRLNTSALTSPAAYPPCPINTHRPQYWMSVPSPVVKLPSVPWVSSYLSLVAEGITLNAPLLFMWLRLLAEKKTTKVILIQPARPETKAQPERLCPLRDEKLPG